MEPVIIALILFGAAALLGYLRYNSERRNWEDDYQQSFDTEVFNVRLKEKILERRSSPSRPNPDTGQSEVTRRKNYQLSEAQKKHGERIAARRRDNRYS